MSEKEKNNETHLFENDHLNRASDLLSGYLDDAFEEFQKNGGLENNPFKGKPIPIQSDNSENAVLNSILKNANILPPWLELQHEIRDQIKSLLEIKPTLTEEQLDLELTKINERIKKYNLTCPPPMQKVRIFKDIIEKQYEKWC